MKKHLFKFLIQKLLSDTKYEDLVVQIYGLTDLVGALVTSLFLGRPWWSTTSPTCLRQTGPHPEMTSAGTLSLSLTDSPVPLLFWVCNRLISVPMVHRDYRFP